MTISDPTAVATRPFDLNERWRDAFNAGDLDLLMTMYEPDAVLVPGPDAGPVRGHDAIRASLSWFLGLGGTLRFTPRHWLEHEDLVLSSIAFTMDGGVGEDGTPVALAGVTDELARRQPDGTWKYVIDHPFGGAC